MQTLFFNSSKSLDEIAKSIFSALEMNMVNEGDSSFSPKGYYFVGTVLGVAVKIDENNYDYEDRYNYTISIRKSIGSKLHDDNALLGFAEIIASVIAAKLDIEIALELELSKSGSMKLKVFSYDGIKVVTTLETD